MNDGGSPITGYIVERKPYTVSGEGKWLKCNYTNVTDTNFTITALGEGEVYEFRVIAKNANGVLSMASVSTGAVTCKAEYSKTQISFANIEWNNCIPKSKTFLLLFYSTSKSRTG